MVVALAFLMAAAAVWEPDPARCRIVREGRIGPEAAWSSDGQGALSISTTGRDQGKVELRCQARLPAGTVSIALSWTSAAVSFAGASTKTSGSGLILSIGETRRELIRSVGEDWLQSDGQQIPVIPATDAVVLTISAVDASPADRMRIDLKGLRVTFAPSIQ